MNRRSFITKALAGLAAVPLLGKLVQGKQAPAESYITPEEADSYFRAATGVSSQEVTESCRLNCAAIGLRDTLWPVFDVTNKRYL